MARRSTPASEPQQAVLTLDSMQRGITRLQKRVNELEAFDPQSVKKRYAPEIDALGKSVEASITSVFGHGTIEYNRYIVAAQIDPAATVMAMFGSNDEPISRLHEDLEKGKQACLAILRKAIEFLNEEIAEQEAASAATSVKPRLSRKSANKVFVVHGHDEAILQAVARFLEKLGLQAVILREQADQGRTIIEKFEDSAAEVGFAVVLLTPDDSGAAIASSTQEHRARQNVLFELGYFAGRLGRGKTCLLRKGSTEIPSDLYGVIYTEFDSNGAWKMSLVKEFKAANLDFDANRMWS